jgi:hypothetical protein
MTMIAHSRDRAATRFVPDAIFRAVAPSRGRLGLKFAIGAVAAVLVVSACVAVAEELQRDRASEPMAFHIPEQPLANALQAYGRIAGIQVLYESASAIGRQSSAVDGNLTPGAALYALLQGTDLRVSYTRPDAVTLASTVASVDGTVQLGGVLVGSDLSLGTLRVRSAGSNDARLQDFNQRLQADIENALRKNPRTRDGSYRAVLELWIDPSRTVERAELSRSTGDNGRDAAIAAALRGLTVSQPAPSSAPQPIRVAIVVRSLP